MAETVVDAVIAARNTLGPELLRAEKQLRDFGARARALTGGAFGGIGLPGLAKGAVGLAVAGQAVKGFFHLFRASIKDARGDAEGMWNEVGKVPVVGKAVTAIREVADELYGWSDAAKAFAEAQELNLTHSRELVKQHRAATLSLGEQLAEYRRMADVAGAASDFEAKRLATLHRLESQIGKLSKDVAAGGDRGQAGMAALAADRAAFVEIRRARMEAEAEERKRQEDSARERAEIIRKAGEETARRSSEAQALISEIAAQNLRNAGDEAGAQLTELTERFRRMREGAQTDAQRTLINELERAERRGLERAGRRPLIDERPIRPGVEAIIASSRFRGLAASQSQQELPKVQQKLDSVREAVSETTKAIEDMHRAIERGSRAGIAL